MLQKKSLTQEKLNLFAFAVSSTDTITIPRRKKEKKWSYVTCHLSCVTCHVPYVTSHLSLTQRATDTDPRLCNSPTM